MKVPLFSQVTFSGCVIASLLKSVQAYGSHDGSPSHFYQGESSASAYNPHGSVLHNVQSHHHADHGVNLPPHYLSPYSTHPGYNNLHQHHGQPLELQPNLLEQWLTTHEHHLQNSPSASEISQEHDIPQAEFYEGDSDENSNHDDEIDNLHQASESSEGEIDPNPFRRNARYIARQYDEYSSLGFSDQSGSSKSTRRANHKKKWIKEVGEEGPYFTSSDSDIQRDRARSIFQQNNNNNNNNNNQAQTLQTPEVLQDQVVESSRRGGRRGQGLRRMLSAFRF